VASRDCLRLRNEVSLADTQGVESVDPHDLADGPLAELVAELEEQERRISRARTALQKRVDFLASGGYAHIDASAEQLTGLQAEERRVSDERQALHREIARAKAELLRRGPADPVDRSAAGS
jgi:chromosome segregation ATPase